MSSSRKEKVFLIVEPGQDALSTRKLILEAAGYNVISAVSGKQGLKFFAKHPVSGVIVDADIRDIPLNDLVDQVQKNGSMPVFLLSSRLWPPDEVKGKLAAVFEKMSDPADMVKTIAAHYGDPPGVAGY